MASASNQPAHPERVRSTVERLELAVDSGTGVRFDNNWAAISLAPDGSAYVGVLNGLVRVRDRATMPYAGTTSLHTF